MSDARRRLLCRIAIVALCALPTFVVLNWAFFPRSIAQWQSQARQLLSCPVAIGWVESPTPNQLIFHNLRLCDPQSQTWAEFETVDWRKTLDSQQLELSDANLSLSQFTSLVRHLWHQLPQIESGARTVEVHLARITIRSDLESETPSPTFAIKDCRIRIDPGAAQPRATVEFVTDQLSDNPVRWEVICGSDALPTRWSLNTNKRGLPCWLVSDAWPSVLKLGEKSWFYGYLSGELSKTESSVDVSGLQLLDIDPAKIVDSSGPTSAAETTPSIRLAPKTNCAVLVKSARLVDGRLQSIFFEVHCQQGQIATRLLQAAKKWLHVDVPNPSTDEFVEFSQVDAWGEIRDGLLCIYGQMPDGLIARGVDQQSSIFATAASQGLAPQSLAGLFADEGQLPLPVSTASLELLSHLPLNR